MDKGDIKATDPKHVPIEESLITDRPIMSKAILNLVIEREKYDVIKKETDISVKEKQGDLQNNDGAN